jgi:hypothetical protein
MLVTGWITKAKHDCSRFDAMLEEQCHTSALADPDAQAEPLVDLETRAKS